MELRITDNAKLNNGVEIPYFGLGVYLTKPGKETQNAIRYALDVGYRHIDTAAMYGNEHDVGQAVRESSISREDIFITTKLWNDDHGYDNAFKAFDKSLSRLNIGYIDLYLIHWPVSGRRNETWKALEKILSTDKCRAIGVSNYTIKHLNELLSDSSTIPVINQVEFNPFLYQEELLDFCNSNSIQLEAYSPLARGRKLKHPELVSLSKKYSKTPAQIMIRWVLQHKVVVIPKSASKERIIENADVFDFSISNEDMETLNSINENFRVAWDPSGIN
jgi:methylglyoxal/glyoxal reductase